MTAPSLWQHFRHIGGRAIREIGQAIDRLGVKTAMLAVTPHDFYDGPTIDQDFLSRHRHQFPLLTAGKPLIHQQAAYLAPCSTLIGTVVVGKNSSIWYGAVVRGDCCQNVQAFAHDTGQNFDKEQLYQDWELSDTRFMDRNDHHGGAVFIGENTNVQDGSIITARIGHTKIGDNVTIGHLAQIHSATIHDTCLIGMGACISEGATVQSESLIAAGALVPPNTTVGRGELWVGNPARKVRDLSAEERQRLRYQSNEYVKVALGHKPVERLGGNLDENGASVYLIPEERTEQIETGDETPQLQGEESTWPTVSLPLSQHGKTLSQSIGTDEKQNDENEEVVEQAKTLRVDSGR